MSKYQVFKVNDQVIWESNGTTKRGRVVAIIPALCHFYNHVDKIFLFDEYKKFNKYSKTHLSDGYWRTHESYLVLVDEAYLYWPRVNQLKLDRENK